MKEETCTASEIEGKLRRVIGLPFRFTGESSLEQAFSVVVYSRRLAKILCRRLNECTRVPVKQAWVGEMECQHWRHDGVSYSLTRWPVYLPASSVNPDYLQAIAGDYFLCGELKRLILTLNERHYDVMTAATNAENCRRRYEEDAETLLAEDQQGQEAYQESA